jgi:lysylphosphatidylglycerol synthetase-like protein (DUF2156 family)
MTTTSARSPVLAGLLSTLIPGLGQLFNGERTKGLALLCMTGGLWLTIAANRSPITRLLLGLLYLFILVPSIRDAAQTARGQAPAPAGNTAWYVILMLLTVGPFALPLLWQSLRFSRAAKIAWTIAVVLIALSFVFVMAALGPALERLAPSLQPAP